MNSVDYGWAQTHVRSLCEANPRNIGFCLSADRATRFYILLAIRGMERPTTAMTFERFASELNGASRRRLLALLWAKDLGSHRVLSRCSGSGWSRTVIDQLADVLANPERRKVLLRQVKITRSAIQELSAAPADASDDQLDLSIRFGAKRVDYLVAGLRRYGSEVDLRAALETLRSVKSARDLDEGLHKVLLDAKLPEPPWAGTESIRPLRTMRAVHDAGRQFSNCLVDYDYGLKALCGRTVFYVAQIKETTLCVSLKPDRVLRGWRVAEVKGAKNAKPTLAQRNAIAKAFGVAGVSYLPKPPCEFWWDG